MRTKLKDHAERLNRQPLKALSAARAGDAPLSAAGWKISLARHFLDPDADAALLEHGAQAGLQKAASDLFGADIVNPSEGRPALHWALRAPARL